MGFELGASRVSRHPAEEERRLGKDAGPEASRRQRSRDDGPFLNDPVRPVPVLQVVVMVVAGGRAGASLRSCGRHCWQEVVVFAGSTQSPPLVSPQAPRTFVMNFLQSERMSDASVAENIMTCLSWGVILKISCTSARMSACIACDQGRRV